MDCNKIQWKLLSRADISSASPRTAPYGTRRVFPVMPSSSATGPYLAFDFGAESGRAVLAHLHSGVITTEEIHRFPNHPVEYGGALHWDVARLWFEVRKALSGLDQVPLAGKIGRASCRERV